MQSYRIYISRIPLISAWLILLLISTGCSSSKEKPFCDSGILLTDATCLVFESADAIQKSEKEAIETIVRETVFLVNSILPVPNLTVVVRDAPADVIPETGIGGFSPGPDEIIISIDPEHSAISHSISTELKPLLAHEMHHAKRRRSVGYGTTLLEACVTEGLADCFAIEVTGIVPPPWSVALDEAELQFWIDTASTMWNSGYDHNKWFFGSTPDIPRWTGYAIGYKLVKEYLAQNPSRNASDLFGEPASAFIP